MTEYHKEEQLERMVADKAVALGLLASERLTECLELQNSMRPLGVNKSLREILVQKGYIYFDFI